MLKSISNPKSVCLFSFQIGFTIMLFIWSTQGLTMHMAPDHQFVSLVSVNHVQNSSSLLQMNKCRAECLQMKLYFPQSFRYHSVIFRQRLGKVKYFTGNCQFSPNHGQSFMGWLLLKNEINRNYLVSLNQTAYQQQILLWNSYNSACEQNALQLSNSIRTSLGLTHVYENFIYYDNGSFTNLNPFNLTSLLLNITKLLHA